MTCPSLTGLSHSRIYMLLVVELLCCGCISCPRTPSLKRLIWEVVWGKVLLFILITFVELPPFYCRWWTNIWNFHAQYHVRFTPTLWEMFSIFFYHSQQDLIFVFLWLQRGNPFQIPCHWLIIACPGKSLGWLNCALMFHLVFSHW